MNQVPDACTVEVDRRLLPGENREQVWAEFQELITQLQTQDPELDIQMEPPLLEDFPLESSPADRIVQVVSKVSEDVRGLNRLAGVPYGSDASKLARAGIPSIILGPGNIDQAHAADEFVDLDQVVLAAEIYARTILEF